MDYTEQQLEEIKKIASLFKCMGASEDVIHFIIAQSILETGHFQSNIYKENNNLFGMKKAKTRLTTAVNENRGHAFYINKETCIIDYALWLVYNGFNQKHFQNLELFKVRMANSNYCPKNDYITRINKIYNQIKKT